MKLKHIFLFTALFLFPFVGCKKDYNENTVEPDTPHSGHVSISSFNENESCLDEIEESNINLSQRDQIEVIYTDLTAHEPGIGVHGIPVFDGTVTETFEGNENVIINITPLIEEGIDSVKTLFFIEREGGYFNYAFISRSHINSDLTYSIELEHNGETETLTRSEVKDLFKQFDCYLFCDDNGIVDRGPLCPWNWLYNQIKKIKRNIAFFFATHSFSFNFGGPINDYDIFWVPSGGGIWTGSGSTNTGGSGSTTTQYNNHQALQQFFIDCQTATDAQTGAGDGGNPNLPDDQTNDEAFLTKCEQFHAIDNCLNLNALEQIWLFNQPSIRESLGHFIINNGGCGEPQTCGSSDETKAWQKGWLDYRRFNTNDDPIEMRPYQMRYQKVCEKTAGTGMSSEDKVNMLNELRRIEIKYFENVALDVFGDFVQSSLNENCSPSPSESYDNCILKGYSKIKHDQLSSKYPNYAGSGVDINSFLALHGEKKYLATSIVYEKYMEEVAEAPTDPYQWQLAMEVFLEELLPILAEFTPGIGDLIGAYNDFQQENYFWGSVGLVSALVPGDEIIKIIRKSDDVRDAWKSALALYRVWEKLFPLAGTQKVFNKLPQSWKNLPGSKLTDNKKGLKWTKDPYQEIRIMDKDPNSIRPWHQFEYARLKKNGRFLGTDGNYHQKGTMPNDDFQNLTHIPVDQLQDQWLDDFFN